MFRKLLAPLALTAALVVSPASAVTLGNAGFDWDISGATILTLSPVVPGGNQPTNLPCIICGANQPQQPTGFGYNNFGNQGGPQGSTVSYFSTATVGGSLALDQLGTGYSILPGSPFLSALGVNFNFSIGIDVNDTNTAQVLESFWFLNLTDKKVLAVYSPNPLDGTPILAPNNGTGYPDWTLSGFSLANIDPGDQIVFYARITGANDGPDSFFLVPGTQGAVPEMSTWIMMMLGFAGLGAFGYRRQHNKVRLA